LLDIEECVTIKAVIAPARRRGFHLRPTRTGLIQVSRNKSWRASKGLHSRAEVSNVADTSVQREVERWIRQNWLPREHGQAFHCRELRLTPGGFFEFDAVSDDCKIAVTISTSGSQTASGKRGSGKLQKIRADPLFLMMAEVIRRVLLFTEADMYELCKREKENGRLPATLEFALVADLPAGLRERLCGARKVASREVSPGGPGS